MNPLRNNGNWGNLLQQFLQFKKSLQGQDVNQIYNQVINSGKYTPEQIAEAKRKAEEFKDFLK